jgi:hypothetical protein
VEHRTRSLPLVISSVAKLAACGNRPRGLLINKVDQNSFFSTLPHRLYPSE